MHEIYGWKQRFMQNKTIQSNIWNNSLILNSVHAVYHLIPPKRPIIGNLNFSKQFGQTSNRKRKANI